MKKLSQIFITTITIMIIFTLVYTSARAVSASAAVPDISGTWSGTFFNVGVEDYSMMSTISQKIDQISGTASFVITHSDAYPQDVGKSFKYGFAGTIDETGKIPITGNIVSGPPEIVSRAGLWNMDWQLSQDGNAISYNGKDDHGNSLSVLLNRTSPFLPLNVLLGLVIAIAIAMILVAVFVLKKRKDASSLPPAPNQQPPPPPPPIIGT